MGSFTQSSVDMQDFFDRQREWSYATFGPPEHRGPIGPLRHLAKEAHEAEVEAMALAARSGDTSDPQSVHEKALGVERLKIEIVDCLFLGFDAAHRSGMSYAEIARVAMAKLEKNKARTWPDWRSVDPNSAVEHDRSADVCTKANGKVDS